MTANRSPRLLCPLFLCFLLASCAQNGPSSAAKPTTNPSDAQLAGMDINAWTHDLDKHVAALADVVSQLPGHSDAEHRHLFSEFFAGLSQILPTLHGPQRTGQFDQQMRTINSARAQLATGSAELAFEPTIDYGLRAAASALGDIQRVSFANNADITQNLDQLRSAIDQLDVQIGAFHRHGESRAAGAIGRIVQTMSAAVYDRASGPATAATTSAP